jgi:CheY-like chemotaxis protein/nitrogen-specific signal transduction histidine kinase
MVVDDDDLLRESVALTCVSHGYQVLEHASGRQALDALARGSRPDLILLDLCMPQMDGGEFRQRQLADAALSSIPVVVMSADQSPPAVTVSAAAFIPKPKLASDLLPTINSVLSRQTGESSSARPATFPSRRASQRYARSRRLGPRWAQARGVQLEQQRSAEHATIARGVSHVVNNALQSLVSCVQCTARPNDREEVELCRSVLDQAMQCAAMLKKFSDCTVPPASTERVDRELGLIEPSLVAAWRELCPPNVQLFTSNLDALSAARVRPSSLLSMVNELIVNAIEAMVGDSGVVHLRGNLEVRRLVDLGATLPLCNRRPGSWCYLSVEDNGAGISESSLSQIWSPFYSTRFAGRGLGLTAVLVRMQALGGLVETESTLGSGTTIRLMFPVERGKVERSTLPLSV